MGWFSLFIYLYHKHSDCIEYTTQLITDLGWSDDPIIHSLTNLLKATGEVFLVSIKKGQHRGRACDCFYTELQRTWTIRKRVTNINMKSCMVRAGRHFDVFLFISFLLQILNALIWIVNTIKDGLSLKTKLKSVFPPIVRSVSTCLRSLDTSRVWINGY